MSGQAQYCEQTEINADTSDVDNSAVGALSLTSQVGTFTFNQWLAFNYRPAAWVHETWLSRNVPGISLEVTKQAQFQRNLSRRLKLTPLPFSLFQLPLGKLLMADVQALQKLLLLLGALCYLPEIRLLVTREARQQFKQTFDEPMRQYLTHIGPLVVKKAPKLFSNAARQNPLWNEESQHLVDFQGVGIAILYWVVRQRESQQENSQCENAKSWVERMRLKLPYKEKCCSSDKVQQQLAESQELAIEVRQIEVIVKKLVRHQVPECLDLLK